LLFVALGGEGKNPTGSISWLIYIDYLTGQFTEVWPSEGCFLAGSHIQLADGSSNSIEKIKLGDMVLTYDMRNNTVKPAMVVKLSLHPHFKGYLHIVTKDKRELKVTPNHPFFTGSGYVEAEKLKVGDRLYALKGRKLVPTQIVSIEKKDTVVDVYNMEITEYHNYFCEGILCHNVVK